MNAPLQRLLQFPRSALKASLGFSLIELLSVMTVISLLAVATVPAMRSTLDGINVSGAAGVAEAELLLARQTAISRNLPVEVRFYKSDDGTGDAWRMVAIVIPAAFSGLAADEWITPGKTLPGNVIIEDSNDYSTVMTKAVPASADKIAPWTSQESTSAPRAVQGKSYVGFLFNADGSTNLPSGQPWCVTLKNPKSQPTASAPAKNYVSIVVDSLTGRTLSYQP
ncbi:hypothetical protein BH09VER1_BH09VER1_12890 [soil metagenome]